MKTADYLFKSGDCRPFQAVPQQNTPIFNTGFEPLARLTRSLIQKKYLSHFFDAINSLDYVLTVLLQIHKDKMNSTDRLTPQRNRATRTSDPKLLQQQNQE